MNQYNHEVVGKAGHSDAGHSDVAGKDAEDKGAEVNVTIENRLPD